jgi:hypothetical protein
MTRLLAQKYNDFYDVFRVVVKPHIPHPFILEFFDVTNLPRRGLRHLLLKEPIHLSKWPAKRDLPDPGVDVSVDVDVFLRYERNEIKHTRSFIYVTYFRRDPHAGIAKVVENLRFDFHPETGGTDHPLLHAHVFSDKKPNSCPGLLTKNFTIEWDSLGKKLNTFRLPIPNMNLPSVLCCLVACHLGADTLKLLLDKTKRQRESFPCLDISTEQLELFSRNAFAGSQWFERA